jgi:hypothetical protein
MWASAAHVAWGSVPGVTPAGGGMRRGAGGGRERGVEGLTAWRGKCGEEGRRTSTACGAAAPVVREVGVASNCSPESALGEEPKAGEAA